MAKETTIHFVIPGAPQPKGRPKFSRFNGFFRAYTPQKTHDAEAFVAGCFKKVCKPLPVKDCSHLFINIKFYMPIPKGTSKKKMAELEGTAHIKRPDIDNLIKLVCDGLNGTAYPDDNLIVGISAIKFYSIEPRTDVEIKYFK